MALLASLVSLVAPLPCAVPDCRGAGPLCPTCAHELRTATGAGPVGVLPRPAPQGFPPTVAAAEYTGIISQILLQHKEKGRSDLTPTVGRLLARALVAVQQGGAVVVVIPTLPGSRERRGGHPLAEVARWAARAHGCEVRNALVWVRPPRDQAGLSARDRTRNLHGALWSPGLPAGTPVVLVDDVVTTGVTLAEGARALREAGVGQVRAAAVAATRRRGTVLGVSGGGTRG
jgi:predicted amidophosphoribosyltransferase